MNKAEELITCLEGEIAKRDAELCERAEEVEHALADLNNALSELSAIKAQGVVMPERKHTDWRAAAGHETPNHGWNACLDEVARLNAAPVQQVSVPGVSVMARILADRNADACNVNREDNWAIYGQDYIDDVTAMLAAAPTPGDDQ